MTKWTDLPAGVVNAATQRFWQECGEDAGLIAERLNTDLFFTGSLGQYLRSGGYTPSPSNQRARQIMGKNMFGVEEALTHFGLMPHSAELARLTGMPFSERVLESYKNTHILVATLPISIQQIGKKASITLRLFKVTDGQDKRFSEARGGWLAPNTKSYCGGLHLQNLGTAAGSFGKVRGSSKSPADGLHDRRPLQSHWRTIVPQKLREMRRALQ